MEYFRVDDSGRISDTQERLSVARLAASAATTTTRSPASNRGSAGGRSALRLRSAKAAKRLPGYNNAAQAMVTGFGSAPQFGAGRRPPPRRGDSSPATATGF